MKNIRPNEHSSNCSGDWECRIRKVQKHSLVIRVALPSSEPARNIVRNSCYIGVNHIDDVGERFMRYLRHVERIEKILR